LRALDAGKRGFGTSLSRQKCVKVIMKVRVWTKESEVGEFLDLSVDNEELGWSWSEE